ncbi:NERD domain-containing protein [Anaerotignum sp.]|uniref:NERD domain-containing protein n=1 Tax=Anaerotignum sp. TaxID=2039241 RepID=UPI0028ADADF2|nr:NERD domain-containing protein [Anaerotignum sp.]
MFYNSGMLITIPFFLVLIAIGFKVVAFHVDYSKSIYKTIVDVSEWKVFFDKGYYGEFLTVRYLEGISEKERFLANVYLNKANKEDQTTEIDIIYVNEFGIYVLESKNYSGWIFGNDKSTYWTQALNKNTKNKFYNPVFQNAGHISALKAMLGSRYDKTYKSLIIFSERCELKNIAVQTPNVYVIKRNSIRKTIQSLHQEPILSEKDISEIYNLLFTRTKVGEEMKKKHIDNIGMKIGNETAKAFDKKILLEKTAVKQQGEQQEKQEENISDEICPRCGAKMVLRTAQKGINRGSQFWGCSNYPRCRVIQEVSNEVRMLDD